MIENYLETNIIWFCTAAPDLVSATDPILTENPSSITHSGETETGSYSLLLTFIQV